MTGVNSGYISALGARDIKYYPNEITKIPNRGSVGADTDRDLTFSEIAADVATEAPNTPVTEPTPSKAKPNRPFTLWEKKEFGFGDFVDIINPLQHIPIVATIYRNMTGDKIGFAPRVIGGAIWGRIGGFVSGIVNAVVEWMSGKDIGDHIFSALFGKPIGSVDQTVVAQPVNPVTQGKASESATGQIGFEQPMESATWNNPFAYEDRFAELTGHLVVPLVTSAAQSAQPTTHIATTELSALSSYGRNAVRDDSAVNSKFRAVA